MEKAKKIKETFVFVVEPEFIKGTFKAGLLASLDNKRILTIEPSEGNSLLEQELEIPYSLKNLQVLSSYPLSGEEKGPLFSSHSKPEIFNACFHCSSRVNVYLMRKQIPELTRGKRYDVQDRLVKENGFQIMTLRSRVYFNAISILTTGTCPDAEGPFNADEGPDIFARSSDFIKKGSLKYRWSVGSFSPKEGMVVNNSDYGLDDDCYGVLPGIPAEAYS